MRYENTRPRKAKPVEVKEVELPTSRLVRPVIAIVGRPNVGKSTLFNRLIGRRRAIVEDTPGVTRDRHFADADLEDRPVTYIDTGGFVPSGSDEPLADHVRLQAQAAIEEGDVVLMVVDSQVGVTAADEEVARFLRKKSARVLLVVNKCDNFRTTDLATAEFHSLGLGDPIGVAAEHNEGIGTLRELMLAKLPPLKSVPIGDATQAVRVAIVGRPNVGKSTLVNALSGKQRVIVSPMAGTTRDPIDIPLVHKGRHVLLTDTAGIRKKSVITQKVEGFSVMGALRCIDDADVTVLVVDATEAGVDQDQKIAALAEDKGRALVLVINKWDLVREKWKEADYRSSLKWYMKWISWVPMVFVTAKDGIRTDRVLDVALELFDQQGARVATPMLNKMLKHVTTEHPLPFINGSALKMYYVAQVGIVPPAFAFMCNRPDDVPDRYKRYVSNYFRTTLNLRVPMRLFWRERPGKEKREQRAAIFKKRSEHKRGRK